MRGHYIAQHRWKIPDALHRAALEALHDESASECQAFAANEVAPEASLTVDDLDFAENFQSPLQRTVST
jgi:hypothetical protein